VDYNNSREPIAGHSFHASQCVAVTSFAATASSLIKQNLVIDSTAIPCHAGAKHWRTIVLLLLGSAYQTLNLAERA